MKVTLIAEISGTRDGVEWPPPGSVVDLPDDEAVALLSSGAAGALGATPAASSERAVDKKGAEKR
jgi:hypothetical protein